MNRIPIFSYFLLMDISWNRRKTSSATLDGQSLINIQRLSVSISMQCFPVSRANTSGHLYLKLTWAEWKAVEDTSSSILHYSNSSELSEFTLYFDRLLSISVWVYDYDEWGGHWALRNWWSKPSVRTKLLFTTMRKWKERSCFFSFFFSSTYVSVLWEPEGL